MCTFDTRYHPFTALSSRLFAWFMVVGLIFSTFALSIRSSIDGSYAMQATQPGSPLSESERHPIVSSPALDANLASLKERPLPLSFIPNTGQHDPSVHFETHTMGGNVFFTSDEIVLSLPVEDTTAASQQLSVVRVTFEGASASPTVSAGDKLPGIVNYLYGDNPSGWQTNIPTYSSVVYHQIYDGIDLHYEGKEGTLKGTYIVAPYANPSSIQWRYQGATGTAIHNQTGDLHVGLEGTSSPLIEQAPIAWQTIDGKHVPVKAHFALNPNGSVGFDLGKYNPAYPLTIDPSLVYGQYYGGGRDDEGKDVAVGSDGSILMTGWTKSLDFSMTDPLFESSIITGTTDAFVVKTDQDHNIIYSTYIGGSSNDEGNGVAVDTQGNAYIAGSTQSKDFPTKNAIQTTNNGNFDAFAAKISADGQELFYSTLLGGNKNDRGNDIAVDGQGFAYVTGSSESENGFPLTNSMFDHTEKEGFDIFVTRINPNGNSASYSTFVVGDGVDRAYGIAVDTQGNAYLTGETTSTDLRTTTSTIQDPTFENKGKPGQFNAFMIKLETISGSLRYSTVYLGGGAGASNDVGNDITLDSSGNIYVTGWTDSSTFPTTSNRLQGYGGSEDAFITVLNSSANSYLFSTYLGGNVGDIGYGIAVDSSGNIYVTGETSSSDFREVLPPPQLSGTPGKDAFLTVLNSSRQIAYSTGNLGGADEDSGKAIAISGNGVDTASVFIVGDTLSSNIPKASGAQGGRDAFIVEVGPPSLRGEDSGNTPVNEDVGERDISDAINLTDPSSTDYTVSYQAVTCPDLPPNTVQAQMGTDFRFGTGSSTIAAGQTQFPNEIPVTIISNDRDEPNKAFCISITGTGLSEPLIKSYIILDDDTVPVTVRNAGQPSVVEPRTVGANVRATFVANLEKESFQPVIVPFTIKDGSTGEGAVVEAGVDYENPASKTLNFAPGETQKEIEINIINPDDVKEPAEKLVVELGTPSTTLVWPSGPNTTQASGRLGDPSSANVIINDNSPSRKVTFASSTFEAQEGAGEAEITVVLDGMTSAPVTVQFDVSDDTARLGRDYRAPSVSSVTFEPEVTESSFTIPIIDNAEIDTNKTVALDLESIVDAGSTRVAELGTPSSADLVIINDDPIRIPFTLYPGQPSFDDANDDRTLQSSQTISGTLYPEGDFDTYFFEGGPGQRVEVTVTPTDEVSGSIRFNSKVLPYVELRTSNGDNGDNGETLGRSEASYAGDTIILSDTLTVSDTYTVVVGEIRGHEMSYDVSLLLVGPNPPDDGTPGGSGSVYLPLVRADVPTDGQPGDGDGDGDDDGDDTDDNRSIVPGRSLSGTIDPAGDVDSYTLDFEEDVPHRLTVQITGTALLSDTLDPDTPTSPRIEVHIFEDTMFPQMRSESRGENSAVLSATVEFTGTYELRVLEEDEQTMIYTMTTTLEPVSTDGDSTDGGNGGDRSNGSDSTDGNSDGTDGSADGDTTPSWIREGITRLSTD